MPSEVINVGKLMRQEAYLQSGKHKNRNCFKVSKKAITEHISYLKAKIQTDVVCMCEQASAANRKTILEDDVIHCNGRVS